MDNETFSVIWSRLTHWYTRRGYPLPQAEEFAAEVVVRVTQAGKLQEPIRYYYAAARTVHIDYIRRTRLVEVLELCDEYVVNDEYFEGDDDGVLDHLTPQERRVATLIAAGVRYPDIGAELGVSKHAVIRIVSCIREKTRAKFVSKAAALYGDGARQEAGGTADRCEDVGAAVA